MCGICGQLNFDPGHGVNRDEVRAATASLSHRGPDDEGFHFDGPLGLGFRRLSIIDVDGGHQPMSDSRGSIWIVFNGEIFNFKELRSELEGFGHRFKTRSDTEVIIHGYQQWGDGILDRLNGMFGLAIWDSERSRLLVARDAMGIKPVYYRIHSDGVSFGSEIRSILKMSPRRADIDPASIALFLQYRFTPSPYTLFTGIKKLAAGTMLVVERGRATVSRWYRFVPRPADHRQSFHEAKEQLTSLYRAALKRHLISDVPVGLLLSGGIDSSLLLALMNEHGRHWPTYSVGYGVSFADDELADAARTARLFDSAHVSLELTPEMFERYLPTVVNSLEEPVATSSIVPMFAICERARRDVKVALIGQGPDELFGGYTRHLGVHYGGLWRQTPAAVRHAVSPLLASLARAESVKRGLYALDVEDRFLRFRNVLSIVPADRISSLFADTDVVGECDARIVECWSDLQVPDGADELGAFQFLELRSTLPDELLVYGDKLSMAHGLEVRVPYLDREVVEFAQNLPASLKVRFGERKRLHRAVCSDFLPPESLRRKKRGFAANVVDGWFRQSVSAQIESVLLDRDSTLYRFMEPQPVSALLRAHQSGAEDNHKLLFSLVVLEWWLRSTGTVEAAPAAIAAMGKA